MIVLDFFKAIFSDIKTFFSSPLDFGGPLTTGRIIVWAIIAGFAIAAFVCLYNRVFLGRFVAYLIKNKANSSESAKSMKDAAMSNLFLKSALKSGGLFTKIVRTDEENKSDIENVRFYIPEENTLRADRLYAHNGASPVSLLISFVLLIILAAIVYIALPELLQMAENFVEMIKAS